MKKINNKKWLLISSLFLIISTFSCTTLPNYMLPNEPMWKNNGLAENHQINGRLKVVSFNIEFSRAIKKAIAELKNQPDLANADVILLQEMHEKGTQEIADELGYNYVYYAFNYDIGYQQNFGNAILSKFPLENEEKIILPHAKRSNNRKRMVTLATITVNGKNILLCSVHLDTILLWRGKRLDQSKFLTNLITDYKARNKIDYAIIGGDFNTLLKNYRKKVISHYTAIDFDWMTEKVGATGSEVNGWLKPTNDHIFADGFNLIDAGKYEQTEASDHYPIWVEMSFE